MMTENMTLVAVSGQDGVQDPYAVLAQLCRVGGMLARIEAEGRSVESPAREDVKPCP